MPKDGNQTRMIFHLSFPEKQSVNYHTPRELCVTEYNKFDVAVKLCVKAGKGAHMAKSDLKSGKSMLAIEQSFSNTTAPFISMTASNNPANG